MNIMEAVKAERKRGSWPKGPISVDVCFINREGRNSETQLDLYGPDTEAELEQLWEELHDEMDAEIDSVTSVEAYGCIV